MKRPQYVFRPNLNDPQHRRAWELLQQMPSARRKEFLVQAILAAEQTGPGRGFFTRRRKKRPARHLRSLREQYFFLQIVNLCVTLRDKAP